MNLTVVLVLLAAVLSFGWSVKLDARVRLIDSRTKPIPNRFCCIVNNNYGPTKNLNFVEGICCDKKRCCYKEADRLLNFLNMSKPINPKDKGTYNCDAKGVGKQRSNLLSRQDYKCFI